MTAIVIPIMAGVHLLDVAGPAQVFGDAAQRGGKFTVHFVADAATPLVSAQGLPLAPSCIWPALERGGHRAGSRRPRPHGRRGRGL